MAFFCRPECGACCIAPSITGPIPGMPQGKPAGVRCVQLDEQYRCKLFTDPGRPALCAQFIAEPAVCGDNREQALALITILEEVTYI
jgi:Fe-S-cluster containining protein